MPISYLSKELNISIIAALTLHSGCSFLVDLSTGQCEIDSDCAALEGGENSSCIDFTCVETEQVDPIFGCFDYTWVPINPNKTVQMSLTVSTISRQILPNFTVSQCDSLFDRDCVSPIQTKLSDANGVIVFDVPEGFRGHYFSPQQENFAPNILHSFPPPDTELPSTLTSPFLVANLSEVTAAAAVVGVEILPDTGAFLFGVQDCSGNQLAGVTLTATPSQETTETIYLAASGLPDPNLQRTGSAGSGAIANLPPGNVTIKAEHEEFGVLFEQTILAVPGTITGGTILPAQ